MSDTHQITRRTGVVSFFTLISRMGGLVRDAVIAYFFGTTDAADAFYMAFTIPNLLRRFVGEGALTIAFIPIFTETVKRSVGEAKYLAGLTLTYLSAILLFLTVIGIAAAPVLVQVIAWGYTELPEKFALTVLLTRWTFPYIFLVSLAALAMGILNTLKRFASPAAAPIFFNIGMILGALSSPWFDPPILGLAFGVLLGGLAQLILQFFDLYRMGWLPKPIFGSHPALWKLLGLMGPAAYGAAVYQCNVVIIRLFASFLPSGAVSYLWYADRIFEFPVGVFAIAVATAIQPTLSDHVADNNMEAFRNNLNFGLRLNFLITLPAMAGMMVLAAPITRVLFQRGTFGPIDTEQTAMTLLAFALGLPFLGAVRILVPAFYSLKDARSPVLYATVAVVANGIFCLLAVGTFEHVGLALALSLASAINFIGLTYSLRKKIGSLGVRPLLFSIGKVLMATLLMSVVLLWIQRAEWLFAVGTSLWWQAGQLFFLVFAGMALFFGSALLFGCPEIKSGWAVLTRKKN